MKNKVVIAGLLTVLLNFNNLSYSASNDDLNIGNDEITCAENQKKYNFFLFSVKKISFCYPENLETRKVEALNILEDKETGTIFYATDIPDFYTNQMIIPVAQKNFSDKLEAKGNKKVKFTGDKVVVIDKKYNSLFSEGTYVRDGVKHFICQHSFLSKYNDVGPIITFWLVSKDKNSYEKDKTILLNMIESSVIQ